ncbi:MAG TPA: transcriptional regulator NrdR [candidate division Zixibacteria bacterium]|nr:transcriptional repressor NrdR [candidate division Zixibacteria bacterium]MDD4918515.1 transcriptional regulator NrdR [candidate division Zixibacteria bacterium]MDM7973385.1 transcriptional regulator NrdR [candidate division Zixibacteria bacterium]HOD67366.1 transcriptional regulator NrdR [candidate division Zixibacteria bacterium]HOZ07430.1 transcriptional regulator NrdR [candidate division Zixibacteria bacterium]
MKCPNCGHEEDKVVDSRKSHDGRAVRRRRECLNCKARFTTYEYVEHQQITVLKSDGRREPFDRNKIEYGIKLACNKLPVSREQIKAMVDEIEAEVNARVGNEIRSADIGELVMERLRAVNDIAYVRFASVYRQFRDTAEFLEEIKKLLK